MEQRSASCDRPSPAPFTHRWGRAAGVDAQTVSHDCERGKPGPRTDLSWSAGEAGRPLEAWWSGQSSIAGEAALAFGAWQAQSWGAPLPWKALRAGGSWLACIPWGAFDAIAL